MNDRMMAAGLATMTAALLATACGGAAGEDGPKKPTENAGPVVVSTVESPFADEYIGRLETESTDDSGAVFDRVAEASFVVRTYSDLSGRVVLEGLVDPACELWVWPHDQTIPVQRCTLSEGEKKMVTEMSGEWVIDGDELSLHAELVSTGYDAEQPVGVVVTSLRYLGAQMADGSEAGTDESTEQRDEYREPIASPECSGAHECRADQECRDGACLDHLWCDFSDYETHYDLAGYIWSSCSDGKEYAAGCEQLELGYWECHCFVNDVRTATFETAREDDVLDPGAAHRLFNQECGWLLPEVGY